jgi:hypothetical protein
MLWALGYVEESGMYKSSAITVMVVDLVGVL